MSQFESRSEDNEAAGELSPSSLAVGTAWGWPCSVPACDGEELSPCHGTTLALGSQGSAQRVPLGPSPVPTSLKAASGCLLSLTTRFVTELAKVLSDGSSLKPPSPAPRHLGGKKYPRELLRKAGKASCYIILGYCSPPIPHPALVDVRKSLPTGAP